nr:MAG: hypothetical protein [Bacteriophage sp.]
MKSLGLKPTKNSGSGWVEKEDGISDAVICQLKSTDKESIKLNKRDIDVLNYNAGVCHKMPVFAVQFLQSNEVYLLVKPDMLMDIAKYVETGTYTSQNDFLDLDVSDTEETTVKAKRKIKSSSSARIRFNEENEKKFKKERRSAK